MTRNPDSIDEVQPTVAAECGQWTLGTDNDDWNRNFQRQAQEVCGFFKRRSTVRNDDAVDVRVLVDQLVQLFHQLKPG